LEEIIMRRLAVTAAGVATVALLAMGAGTASAGAQATHIKSTFSGDVVSPAGTLCNFTEDDTFTVDVDFILAPNGESPVLLTENITHTNLDTGYSLTETDQVNQIGNLVSSTSMEVGIFWHLRDASGQVVLVKAGEATIDTSTGQLISFTPNSGFDRTYAQIICTALGGSPA
jgi:hypothetical protein